MLVLCWLGGSKYFRLLPSSNSIRDKEQPRALSQSQNWSFSTWTKIYSNVSQPFCNGDAHIYGLLIMWTRSSFLSFHRFRKCSKISLFYPISKIFKPLSPSFTFDSRSSRSLEAAGMWFIFVGPPYSGRNVDRKKCRQPDFFADFFCFFIRSVFSHDVRIPESRRRRLLKADFMQFFLDIGSFASQLRLEMTPATDCLYSYTYMYTCNWVGYLPMI